MQTFELRDHLSHSWAHERVSFPLAESAKADRLRIRDDKGRLIASQVSGEPGSHRIHFIVDELAALGHRSYRLEDTGDAVPMSAHAPSSRTDGNTVVLENGLMSVRLPGPAVSIDQFPAPILAVRRGQGPWLGEGRLMLSDFLKPKSLESARVEQGPLWVLWRLRYLCQAGERYTVEFRLPADQAFVEVTESSELCRDSRWEFSMRKGLEPDHTWTHPHQVSRHGDPRLRPLPFADAKHRNDVGSVQFPVYSGIWIPDDYYYIGYLRLEGGTGDCVAAAGVNGGLWDYPYENQIDACFSEDRDAFFRASIKAGHRRWLLLAADRQDIVNTTPFYANTIHRAIKAYETPLDTVKDYVLDWEDLPASARPFVAATRDQLVQARRSATEYKPFRDYVAALNPDLPGDYTYYHAGTHRVFKPDCRNDPAVLYVTAGTDAERRKQAGFLKDVVMNGLKNRREGMLDHVGHCDGESASINVGRGLRPWAVLYDFAAAEGAFSEAEQKLARATFAFYGYKINDPDYWPAEHLTLRDDHPRSAHRTHWFPWRHSDWAFYNIDNIPHNFHGDLWSAAGCVAMALPTHPESRRWVKRTLEFWEAELTQWIFPEGAWLESSTYTLNSMKDYLIFCRALANSHIRDYFSDERIQRAFRFYAETLLPHDDRIKGASFPVLGDASYPNGFAYVIGWMAGLCAEDGDFSRLMQTVWKQTGEFLTEPGRFGLNFCDFLFINPSLPTRPAPERKSRHYKGLGVMLRHAPGTPEDIYMFIKGGIIYSHFHEPEGTFILWWNGKPLCDEYGVQYGKGTSECSQHNCIEVKAGAWSCYNKGDISRFLSIPAFEFVTVDAPILQAWLAEGQAIWGFRGEMGPAGWHRRHILLMKPYYLMIYDDLECAHPTTYHLNVMADGRRQMKNLMHYDGRHGVDLEFLALDLGAREIRHSEFDVSLSNSAFVPPPKFYQQLQLHIDGEPNQHYATVLVPHDRGTRASVEADAETGGARITVGEQVDHAMLFPSNRRIDGQSVVFEGMSGAVRTQGKTLTLLQVLGTSIGFKGRLQIDGDGPFSAELGANGKLQLTTDGLGRWLTIRGKRFNSADLARNPVALETVTDGVRLRVPPGKQTFKLE